MITPDDIRSICLTAIFSNNELSQLLTLKGGNALKLLGLTERQSQDLDFSISDSRRLDIESHKILFENLITNAIKYSYKPGEILIGLYEKDNTAIVVFRNKGDHLSKEKAEKLFDRFYRLDESRNTNTGGSGLGLAISKNIVELHEGKIWAESIGDNISFYVQLNL